MIISAGCLKKKELIKLINLINSKKKYKMKTTLLHCVSSYPLLAENCNFFKFDYLKSKFHNVGYSGHFDGIEDAIYALFNGATLIEKHFTTNKRLPGRDNKFALNYDDFKKLNDYRIKYEKFIISRGVDLQKCEKDIFKNYRGRWSKKIKN